MLKIITFLFIGIVMSTSQASEPFAFSKAIEMYSGGELQADQLYKPFLDTEFFVLVSTPENATTVTGKGFRFHIVDSRGKPMVVVSDNPENLRVFIKESMSAIRMTGKKLIESLHSDVGVAALSEKRGFNLPADLVNKLRSSS